ncbi:hypothetical protein GCM10007094_23630 [Pseudovibrio japonicus]|uniref:Secreted protein n=1 Tax=Pseudovibrio japonicus TaxID=366534 RepID=A0ABQ3ED62_9HYPH|nr:hypothetical protein [Pseudovibrio japonicus]GHB33956.1 hypothetical protein GCM10007094_23630 [Pseudovibrio japonicus]
MRVFLVVCSLLLGTLQLAQAAPTVTAQDLVFGERSLIGQRVQVTGCTWIASGVSGMRCRVFYNGQFLTTLWAKLTNDQMPLVRLLLDNCVKENPRCQFDIEASVKDIGQRPELKDIEFDF